MPKNRLLSVIALGLIIVGGMIAYIGLERDILLMVDGQPHLVRTRAVTLNNILREAGYSPTTADRIFPSLNTWMIGRTTAWLDQSRAVVIHDETDDSAKTLQTAERIPANLLTHANFKLYPGDTVAINGVIIDPYTPLPDDSSPVSLEVRRALSIMIKDGPTEQIIFSAEDTILEVLWQAGISVSVADKVFPAVETRVEEPMTVVIERAIPITIILSDQTVQTASNAESVGQLLAEAGIPLQGLDYAIPAEDEPLPEDRQVRIVRVNEEITLEQKPIPFKSSYQQDDQTELDQRRVITAGEYGIEVSRVRIRLENGEEVSRNAEAAWVAKEPQDQLLGYGTQAVVKTIDTPSGTLEYWRAVNVFATSYSPCRLGIPNYCNSQTSSGAQLQQGIVAVTRAWYSWMRGQRVYIPGYGVAVVADVGGGIPGRYWVDLGYTDADFKSWASNVTMYFLTPIPAAIPWILP